MQAADIEELAAQVTENNALIEELASSFPDSHAGTNITIFNFAEAFAQVSTRLADVVMQRACGTHHFIVGACIHLQS